MEGPYAAVFFDLFGTLVDDGGAPRPGARALLDAIPTQRWGIVTSCGGALARALIARAQLRHPPLLVAAEDVSMGKPDPECYTIAAERAGVSPRESLAVEDSTGGAAAAIAAGCTVLLVTWGARMRVPERAIAIERLAHVELRGDERGGVWLRLHAASSP